MTALPRKRDLLAAVQNGDIGRLDSDLKAGGNVNAIYPNGQTLLIGAVVSQHREMVGYLLQAGADRNQRDFHDRTPLMYAADKGSYAISHILLDSGADVNARNKQGRTALMYAAYKDEFAVAQRLLNAGADVNAADNRNRTALNYARLRKSESCQKLLRERGGTAIPDRQTRVRSLPWSLKDAMHMDEFTELQRWPRWDRFSVGVFSLLTLVTFAMQFVFAPFSWLFLLLAAYSLLVFFPSVLKLWPLYRELQDRRAGRGSAPDSTPAVRASASGQDEVEFVSQLMQMGSRELSTIHHVQPDAQSLVVLDSVFKSRLRSVLLAVSMFALIVFLFLPGLLWTGAVPFWDLASTLRWQSCVPLVLCPLWLVITSRLESRLRLDRVRLVQQDRDRLAGQVSTLLNADDLHQKQLPTDFGLYLRAFMTTNKLHIKGFDLETLLAYSIAPTLPLVALGKPGEHLGAGRIQTSDEGWQDEILRLMRAARLILIIPSHRPGTLWEIATLRDQGFLEKTIFIMPPEMNFQGRKFSLDWASTVRAARDAGVEFPQHIANGAFFRLDKDGQFEDYAPFLPEEFLQEFDPVDGGGNYHAYAPSSRDDASMDAESDGGDVGHVLDLDGSADGGLGADAIDSGADVGADSGADGGGGDRDGDGDRDGGG